MHSMHCLSFVTLCELEVQTRPKTMDAETWMPEQYGIDNEEPMLSSTPVTTTPESTPNSTSMKRARVDAVAEFMEPMDSTETQTLCDSTRVPGNSQEIRR